MDEFKPNGASKLKNALRWLAAYVRYHCLRAAAAAADDDDDDDAAAADDDAAAAADDDDDTESAYLPTEVHLLSHRRSAPCMRPACTLPSADKALCRGSSRATLSSCPSRMSRATPA